MNVGNIDRHRATKTTAIAREYVEMFPICVCRTSIILYVMY